MDTHRHIERTIVSRRALARSGFTAGLIAAGHHVLPASQSRAVQLPGRRTALHNATVIDGTGAPPRANHTVLIENDRIIQVAPAGSLSLPEGTETIDLPGTWILPGLHDMHVHSPATGSEAIAPPLYLANGVTTVREMDGAPELHEWRRRIEHGDIVGPTMVIASPIIDGAPSPIGDAGVEGTYEVRNATEGRSAVQRAIDGGADFIKIYHRVPPDAFFAIADEAARLGVPLAGHTPDLVPIEDASEAGQQSFEHLFWTWFSTSARHAEIRRALDTITIEQGDYSDWFRQIHAVEMLAATSFDPDIASRIFESFVARGTAHVPTLWMHNVLDAPANVPTDDSRYRFVPAFAKEFHTYGLEELYLAGRTDQQWQEWEGLFAHRLRLIATMKAAGVTIFAGSDSGTPPYSFPGFTLHDELALLVQAGLSPMEAIRAATQLPAAFLGHGDEWGTIEAGKRADLLIVEADPLLDIRNTRHVHSVMARGSYIDPAARRQLLMDVEQAAAHANRPHQPTAGCGIRCVPTSHLIAPHAGCACHRHHGAPR